MLKYLKISNYILVKELTIDFTAGLNIFSGETGAGKSVIVEAINTALGGNINSGMLFDQSSPASIEICFAIDNKNQKLKKLISDYGLDQDEKELFFTKIITTSYKAKTYLNGIRSTNTVVKKFKEVLIDFHSQRNQQQLFDKDFQLKLIDDFGNNTKELTDFQKEYKNCKNKLKLISELNKEEKENRDKFELYSYQLEEINKADLEIAEDQKLQAELELLNHSEELINLQEKFHLDCFEAEKSIFDQINYYYSLVNDYQSNNEHLKNAGTSLRDCLSLLEEISEELIFLTNSIDLDPNRLIEVKERVDFLNNLRMKYSKSIDDILKYRLSIKDFIKNYSSSKEKISILNKELAADLVKLKKAADTLSKKRKAVAKKFAEEIQKNIKQLAIPDGKVSIKFNDLIYDKSNFFEQLAQNGKDQVEIYFSANLGVDQQPLKIAASGGEISRFLLVVKKIMAQYLHSNTIIFDEIDTGIGGKTAEFTGKFIDTIARHHQVICITHLAQIAVFADNHLSINKLNKDNISCITVKKLDNKLKIQEIARMLSGSESNLALKHASELLNKSGRS